MNAMSNMDIVCSIHSEKMLPDIQHPGYYCPKCAESVEAYPHQESAKAYAMETVRKLATRLGESESALAESKELSELRLKSEQKYAWRNIELNTENDALRVENEKLKMLVLELSNAVDLHMRHYAINRFTYNGTREIHEALLAKAQSLLSGEAK